MSGTIPLSLTQQLDKFGKPLDGGKLYFFVAGSVATPQNAFVDIGLTNPWPNPITLDDYGRIPQFFLADGLIKVRLTDKAGVTILVGDNIQVIGPSSGGGGGGGATIDATTILQTGDLKARYGTGTHTGWVRANGRTIGNAASSATELADNILPQALYIYLYGADPNLATSSPRTGNALNDFNSGIQLALPDWRGRVIAGMDDMGNTLAGNIPAAVAVTGSTTSGSALVYALSSIAGIYTGMKVTGSGIPPGATVVSLGQQLSGTATLNNTVNVTALAGVNATTQLRDGMQVFGAGIAPGTTIAARPTSSTITLSQAANMPTAGQTLVALTFADPNALTLSANAVASATGVALSLAVLAGNVLGASGGSASQRLSQSQLPNIALATTIGVGQGEHTHTGTSPYSSSSQGAPGGGNNLSTGSAATLTIDKATLPRMAGVTPLGGADAPLNSMQPTMVATIYIKL